MSAFDPKRTFRKLSNGANSGRAFVAIMVVQAGSVLNACLKRRPHFLIANMAEYKQANRRRQFVLLARRVDLCNRLRQRRALGLRDLLQPAPDGSVSANRNRPLND